MLALLPVVRIPVKMVFIYFSKKILIFLISVLEKYEFHTFTCAMTVIRSSQVDDASTGSVKRWHCSIFRNVNFGLKLAS